MCERADVVGVYEREWVLIDNNNKIINNII